MDEEHGAAQAARIRSAPGVVAPTNNVNVALPFSKITIEEPSKEFTELVAIVAGLAAAMEHGAEGQDLAGLRRRAEALVARMR
jgi:hypothetical protein